MSCEGPVVSVRPQHALAPSTHLSAMSLDPRNSHLFLQKSRARSSSASGQLLEVPEPGSLSKSAPSSPVNPESSLPVSLSPSSDFYRSASLPRGVRGVSAEPAQNSLSNSTPEHSMRGALSPRFIRRTATIDTTMISKEEFDVSVLSESACRHMYRCE